MREQVVTSLVAEVAEAAGETPFEFIELSGAVKGYADGRPTGAPSPTIAWQLGVDVAAVAARATGSQAMGYAADPERVAAIWTRTGTLQSPSSFARRSRTATSAEELRAKVGLARSGGCAGSTSTTTASCGWTRWTGYAPPCRPEGAAGERARVPPVVDQDDAVDEDVRDPSGRRRRSS